MFVLKKLATTNALLNTLYKRNKTFDQMASWKVAEYQNKQSNNNKVKNISGLLKFLKCIS
jgi:hypothetical protein